MVDTLQDHLLRACQALGLKILLQQEVRLPSGNRIVAHAVIPELGPNMGMIIVKSFDEIRGLTSELAALGFGYSVLSDPGPNGAFDLHSYVEMFSDWGWSGDQKEKPSWLISAPEE